MNTVKIETKRTGYSIDQVKGKTVTVGELIDYLSQFDEDSEIVFSNDNGYTYGEIDLDLIEEVEDEEF